MPFSEDVDEDAVEARAENADEGVAEGNGQAKRPNEQEQGNHANRPEVEGPLAFPKPHRVFGEWAEVKERPEVHGVGPTRPKQVAKEVEVKGQEAEESDSAFAAGKGGEEGGDENRAESSVQEVMVVMEVIVGFFAPESLIGHVQEQAQAVDVGQNAGECDQAAVAGVVGGFGGEDPGGQEMGFRIHFVIRFMKRLVV